MVLAQNSMPTILNDGVMVFGEPSPIYASFWAWLIGVLKWTTLGSIIVLFSGIYLTIIAISRGRCCVTDS